MSNIANTAETKNLINKIEDEKVFSSEKEGMLVLKNQVVKTVVSSVAAYLIFGVQIAVICIVVDTIFGVFDLIDYESTWISGHCFTDAKNVTCFYAPYLFISHLIAGIVFGKILKFNPPQAVGRVIKNSFSKGLVPSVKMIFFGVVRAPISEEIFFRGFLLEKLKILQVKVLKIDDKIVSSKFRIIVQAVIFGAVHCNRMQSLVANIVIFNTASFFGYVLGSLKENHTLGGNIAMHSLINTFFLARLYFFGF